MAKGLFLRKSKYILPVLIAGALLGLGKQTFLLSEAIAKERRYGIEIGVRGGPPLFRIEIVCGNCHSGQQYEEFGEQEEQKRHEQTIMPKYAYQLASGDKVEVIGKYFLQRDKSEKDRIVLYDAKGKKNIIFPDGAMILKNLAGKPSFVYVPEFPRSDREGR